MFLLPSNGNDVQLTYGHMCQSARYLLKEVGAECQSSSCFRDLWPSRFTNTPTTVEQTSMQNWSILGKDTYSLSFSLQHYHGNTTEATLLQMLGNDTYSLFLLIIMHMVNITMATLPWQCYH